MVRFLLPERVLTRRSRQWWFTLLHGPPLDAAASNPAGFITSTMYKSTVRVMLKKVVQELCSLRFPESDGRRREPGWGMTNVGGPKIK